MKKNFLLFLGLLCLTAVLPANAQPRFSRAGLSADLDSLRHTLVTAHPDLFALLPEAEFDRRLEQVRRELTDSMTAYEFFVRIAPLVSGLGDGHTNVFPVTNEYFIQNGKVLPYTFEIEPNEVVLTVAHDLSGRTDAVPVGARILSINDRTPAEWMERLVPFRSGESEAFRMKMIAELMNIYMYMLEPDSVYRVTYSWNGETRSTVQEGVPVGVYYFELLPQVTPAKDDPYSLSVDEAKGVAVIDFRAFEYNPAHARHFLDSAFSLIREKGIQNLIVDIRKNGGGDSQLGDEFFQYISPVPFTQFGNVSIQYSETYQRNTGRYDVTPGTTELYLVTEKDLKPLRENPLRYTGNTYLLTSSNTFSSAGSFAWAFHHFGMGTIVGEETGGWIVSFGDMLDVRLPNSGIQYSVSHKKFYGYGADDSHRHGTRPDYPVPADRAMEKAYELIEASR